MTKNKESCGFFPDTARGVLFSVLFSLVFSALTALILIFTGSTDKLIQILSLVIKALSLFLAVLFGFKNCNKGALKGLATAGVYDLLLYIVNSLDKSSAAPGNGLLIDMATCLVIGIASGVIAVNIKGKS